MFLQVISQSADRGGVNLQRTYQAKFSVITQDEEEFRQFMDTLQDAHLTSLSLMNKITKAAMNETGYRTPLAPYDHGKYTSKPVYEDAYWRFVNAKTLDEANTNMDEMLGAVTMKLEPRADGKSWVEDPEVISNETVNGWGDNPPWPVKVFCVLGLAFIVVVSVLHLTIGLW